MKCGVVKPDRDFARRRPFERVWRSTGIDEPEPTDCDDSSEETREQNFHEAESQIIVLVWAELPTRDEHR